MVLDRIGRIMKSLILAAVLLLPASVARAGFMLDKEVHTSSMTFSVTGIMRVAASTSTASTFTITLDGVTGDVESTNIDALEVSTAALQVTADALGVSTAAIQVTVDALSISTASNKVSIDTLDASTQSLASGAGLNDGAVTTNKIDGGAVTTSKISDDAVTFAKMSDNGCSVGQIPKIAGGGVWTCSADAGAGAGNSVQTVSVTSGASTTTTAIIPVDNTIPQLDEGSEWIRLAVTPVDAGNTLIIRALMDVSADLAGDVTCALFQDSISSATQAGIFTAGVAQEQGQISLLDTRTAGTTSEIIFQVQCGGGVGGTVRFNADPATGAKFGGVSNSGMTIREHQP